MGKIQCPFCGEMIEEGGKFCTKCGAALNRINEVGSTAAPEVTTEEVRSEAAAEEIRSEEAQPKMTTEEIRSEAVTEEAQPEVEAEEIRSEATGEVQPEVASEEPVVAEPATIEPPVEEPVAAEPVTAEPPVEEPAVAEQVAAEPIVTEPPVMEPEKTEPEKKITLEQSHPEQGTDFSKPSEVVPISDTVGSMEAVPETPGEQATPQTDDNGDGSDKKNKKEKKEKKEKEPKEKKVRTKPSFGKVLASVVIFIIALCLGLGASVCFYVRRATTKEAVARMVNGMDFADIGVGFIDKKPVQSILLDKYMTGVFNKQFAGYIKTENMRKLLNEDFVKEFVENKLNDYIEDFLEDTGDGRITVDELEELLYDNWIRMINVFDLPEEAADYILSFSSDSPQINLKKPDKGIIEMICKKIDDDMKLEELSVSSLTVKLGFAYGILRLSLAYPVIIAMASVCVVLLVLLIVMNIRYGGGFRYMGTAFTITGAFGLLIAEASIVLPWIGKLLSGIEYSLVASVVAGFVQMPLCVGVMAVFVGIIFNCIGKAVRRRYKKKLAAQETEAQGYEEQGVTA